MLDSRSPRFDSRSGARFAPACPRRSRGEDADLHEAGLTSMARVKLMLAIEAHATSQSPTPS